MKKFSKEIVAEAFKNASQPIRDSLQNVDDTFFLADLGDKYKLHVDQIGDFAEMNRDMLLGLLSPQDFFAGLKEMNLGEGDARQIMSEINARIFKPLQDKMRGAPIISSPPQVPVPSYTPAVPKETSAPPQPPPRPAMPAQTPPMRTPPPPPRQSAPPSLARGAPPANLPGVMEPDHMLEDHEVGHITLEGEEANAPTHIPTATTSNRPLQTPPLPTTQRPVAPQPPTQHVRPPVIPTSSAPKPPPSIPPLTKYNKDPYREPVDEK